MKLKGKKIKSEFALAVLLTLCFMTVAMPSYAFDLDSLLGSEEVDPSFKSLVGDEELPMIGDSDVKRENAAAKLDEKNKKPIPIVRKEKKTEPVKTETPVTTNTEAKSATKADANAKVETKPAPTATDTEKVREDTVKKEEAEPGLLEFLGGGDDLSSAVNEKSVVVPDSNDVKTDGTKENTEEKVDAKDIKPDKDKSLAVAPNARVQKLSSGGAEPADGDNFMFPNDMESFGDADKSEIVPLSQREGGATPAPTTPATSTQNITSPAIGDNVVNQSNKRGAYMSPPVYGTNAGLFNVGGIMLKMSVPQVTNTMKKNGFTQTIVNKEIPNFIKWKNEIKCQSFGEVIYEKLAYCIQEIAKRDGHEYVESVVFNKYSTKERIEVFFTSNFTKNRVYKIEYKAGGDPGLGTTPKDRYLKDVWMRDFFTRIYKKYGNPDDRERFTWSAGENKPFLKVAPGYIVLADPSFLNMDSAMMARSDGKSITGNTLSF